MDNTSCNDSGLPSDTTSNTLSSSSSTLEKQQQPHLALKDDNCCIDHLSWHVASKEIQPGERIERSVLLDCDERTALISSNKNEMLDRKSTESDLNIQGCKGNDISNYSQTQCNGSQPCCCSKPRDQLFLLRSHDSNIYQAKCLEQDGHSVLHKHPSSQENDESTTLKISEEKNIEEYVKQWIRKSLEDLEIHDSSSTLDRKNDYTRNSDNVQEYVRVDHDGSVKSNSERQTNSDTQPENSNYHILTQPLILQSKNIVQCRTLDEYGNNEIKVISLNDNKQSITDNSSKTFSDETNNVSHSDTFNTKPIRNLEHVSIDISLEGNIPSTHDENKNRESQEDLEEINTRFNLIEFNSLTTENETSGDLCSGISDYLLVDQSDSSHCEQPDDDTITVYGQYIVN